MKQIKNKFELPPGLFGLVCEKAKNPEDALEVYEVLLEEIEIQAAGAYNGITERGRFPMIMQCALILEGLREEVAVKAGLLCKECYEPLVDDGACDNQKCSLYMKV